MSPLHSDQVTGDEPVRGVSTGMLVSTCLLAGALIGLLLGTFVLDQVGLWTGLGIAVGGTTSAGIAAARQRQRQPGA